MARQCAGALAHHFRNKRILITAGPTWVPIDSVRVISNTASGETGRLLAQGLQKIGARVTLLSGPVCLCGLNRKVRVINFRFFDELRNIIKQELRASKYDLIIHSAAVSDFRPSRRIKNKITSGRAFILRLKAQPKIINYIRALNPRAKLVIFKLESGINDAALIARARESLLIHKADFAVANRVLPRYKAFILDKARVYAKAGSKKILADKLIAALGQLR
jgi:phosphopantothenoylcysteine decarboxylase/phosphopantothenate--cysteine ligase